MIRKLTVVLLSGVICLWGVTSAFAAKYIEAPMLKALVAAGELPSVEGRLPLEPAVVESIEEIGQHGGTIHVFATNPEVFNDLGALADRGRFLGRFAEGGSTVVGDLAKELKLSNDKKSLTIYLRKGTKWSDGTPFTAEDIVFALEDVLWNNELNRWNPLIAIKRIKKIDDYTVRLEADVPQPAILAQMGRFPGSEWFMYLPKHYLKRWHIKYNSEADELAKEEGFNHWPDAFKYHLNGELLRDVNTPTLQPWILKELTTTTKLFERNPYYWRVDAAGNQLPYIDKIVSTIVDTEVYQIKIISGEADVAYSNTSLENYPLYKENEDKGDYRVILIPGANGAEIMLPINLNEPNLALRKIYQDVRFRRALSLAINREEINKTVYFGLGTPRQATVVSSCSYYKPEWGEEHPYARWDPDEANRLLDEIGLTERDQDGFRVGPDGKSMLLVLEFSSQDLTIGLELTKEYWEAVGIKVLLKPQTPSLFEASEGSPKHGIKVVKMGGCEEILNYLARSVSWSRGDGWGWADAWGIWLSTEEDVRMGKKTLEDFEGGKLPGEEPPEEFKKLDEWVRSREEVEFGSEEYMALSQKIYDFHAEKLILIGTVGMASFPYIAKNNIGNVPKALPPAATYAGTLAYYAEQLFFKP